MWVKCMKCNRSYDDSNQWTICPHSPLGQPIDDYCPKCDTLRSIHGPCKHQYIMPKEQQMSIAPNQYQKEAARTEASQWSAWQRLSGMEAKAGSMDNEHPMVKAIRLMHGIIGIINELGEITSEIQRRYWYGKPITDEDMAKKIKDEAGDLLWHLQQVLSSFGVKLEDVLLANLAKLKVRYPNAGWEWDKAQEENRDRAKEAEVQQNPCVEVADDYDRSRQRYAEKSLVLKGVLEEIEKLKQFKAYVHKRLDDAGVPKEVPGEQLDQGCRIGGRLDWVLSKLPTYDGSGTRSTEPLPGGGLGE